MPKEFLIIAHRGASGIEPENTLRSFQKALDDKVDMIETDVFACKTGELVVIHNNRLRRTTNGKGFVTKTSYSTLRTLDAGKGEVIPTVHEVVALLNRRAKINFELKGKNTLSTLLKIINNYVKKEGWNYDDFILSSFNRHTLKKIHLKNRQIRIGVLLRKNAIRGLKFAESINAYSVHVKKTKISKTMIDQAHSSRLKVFVWTVNDPQEVKLLRNWGCNGVFTDYPNRSI